MIVEFSVGNFRSIKEIQTISFLATGLKSAEDYSSVDGNNIVESEGNRILKTVGIYGANASGKSNIIRALDFFLQAIKSEASSESNLKSLWDPFLYQENPLETESFFQIVVLIEEKKFRYGFTVKKNPEFSNDLNPTLKESEEIISNEWLYGTKDKNQGEYFIRKGLSVRKDRLPNSEKIPDSESKHTLFLTHAAAFNRDGICASIRDYLKGWTVSNFSNGIESFRWNSIFFIEGNKKKDILLDLLSSFNLKYDDVFIKRDPNKNEGFNIPLEKIFLRKNYINEKHKNQEVILNLYNNESSGTQKLFDLAGLLLRAFNLPIGAFIIIDEVDSNFHPSLLIKVIQLFNDPSINKSRSQLLFTSHDTNLMSPSIMRRDQFYFTEKSDENSTRLYSLADLRGIRNDADFAKQYLAGIYGAIPMLESIKENSLKLDD